MKPHYRILRLNHGRAPTVQYATLKEAETEALRLAGQHPGETFEILQCLGIARTTEPAVFWNDGARPLPSGKKAREPGDGYRFLVDGDTVEPGDQVPFGDDGWIDVDEACVGLRYGIGLGPRILGVFRRKLPETRYPTTPLPEGFDRWECRGMGWGGSEGSWYATCYLGPRLIWDVKASPGPTNRVSTLEYWEAVKDGPSAYRMLEPGEVIEEGDEFQSLEWDGVPRGLRDWKPVSVFAIGERLLSSNAGSYRRLINKKQAP